MRRRSFIAAGLAAAAGPAFAQSQQTAYDFTFEALEGGALPLEQFRGRALLVVNTASECGFTGQYSGLRRVYDRFADQPLTIIGVPSNDFGGQEPGTAEEIRQLCDGYRIEFPMAGKTQVIGPERHPFYAWAEAGLGAAGVPAWNFHKILIGRDGLAREGIRSNIDPVSTPFMTAVERALA